MAHGKSLSLSLSINFTRIRYCSIHSARSNYHLLSIIIIIIRINKYMFQNITKLDQQYFTSTLSECRNHIESSPSPT